MEKSVGVVVVTYNRVELLKITLCKIFSQSYKNFEILVVNNNSSDGTKEYLSANDKVQTLNLSDNLGPAGGFHEGVKYFTEVRKKDFIWLMDDDFFPAKECLKELLCRANNTLVAFPFVRLKSFKTHNMPSWSGPLIATSIVQTVGYPMKELFFWAEDTEYFQVRIQRKYGFECKWISEAKGVHFAERKTNYRQPWRYYYETRNMIYVMLHLQKLSSWRVKRAFKNWIKFLGLILFFEKNKFVKLKYFVLGTFHGISQNLGKHVDPKGK